MRRYSLFACFASLLLAGGCAQVVIEKGGVGEGYDVFRPEPYLLVFTQTTTTTGSAAPDSGANTNTNKDLPQGQPPSTQPAGVDPNAVPQAKAGGGGGNDSGGGGGGAAGGAGGSGGAASAEGLTGPGAIVIWLPNYSERYRVHSTNFLAVSGAQFTIRDGWMLTGITDQSDNTALLTAGSSLLSSVLGTASGAATGKGQTGGKAVGGQTTTIITQKAQLFKFLFDADGNFYGMSEVQLDEQTLDRIRDAKDNKTRLVPLRSPTYDGRPPEDRGSRDTDSSKKPWYKGR